MLAVVASALCALSGCSSGQINDVGSATGGSGSGSASSSSGATGVSSGAVTGTSSGVTTSSAGSSTGGAIFDAGPERCDQASLTWTSPTSDVDGGCLHDLRAFLIEWGPVSGGPYPNAINVGLPCTPGAVTACGNAGSVVQLNCAYRLSGLTDGLTYFVTEAVSFTGISAPSAEVSTTISCGYDGGSLCNKASECPPYLMCDIDGGDLCDYYCRGAGCACDSDSQCQGNWLSGGRGEGMTCVNGFCAQGCNSPTDCGLGGCCDLTNGTPGTCVATPSANCLCAADNQCNGDEPGAGYVCNSDDLCVAGCKSGYDCPSTAACDQSQGFIASCVSPCAGGLCSCTAGSQCADGGLGLGVACLGTGLCGASCATGADCPDTQACDTTTATCSAGCGMGADPSQCACASDSQCAGGVSGTDAFCNIGFCSTPGMDAGACMVETVGCDAGYVVDVNSDPLNCGGCGVACGKGYVCGCGMCTDGGYFCTTNCLPDGQGCTAPGQCEFYNCSSTTKTCCSAFGQDCTQNADCCGSDVACQGGTCCGTSGASCTTTAECCSGSCSGPEEIFTCQ